MEGHPPWAPSLFRGPWKGWHLPTSPGFPPEPVVPAPGYLFRPPPLPSPTVLLGWSAFTSPDVPHLSPGLWTCCLLGLECDFPLSPATPLKSLVGYLLFWEAFSETPPPTPWSLTAPPWAFFFLRVFVTFSCHIYVFIPHHTGIFLRVHWDTVDSYIISAGSNGWWWWW